MIEDDYFGNDAKELNLGTNVVNNREYVVDAFVTWQYGTCYKIEPMFSMKRKVWR